MTYKQAKLTKVNKDNTITVTLANGTTENIGFDILALCTGASYSAPIKNENALTLDDRKKGVNDFYRGVE